MTKSRAKRLLRLTERVQELHEKSEAAKKRKANKYARDLYAKTKKRKRAERIATNKIKREAKAQARAEKRAEKLRIAAERKAKRDAPSKKVQEIMAAYQGGLRVGFERGRDFERHNGKDTVTPDVL